MRGEDGAGARKALDLFQTNVLLVRSASNSPRRPALDWRSCGAKGLVLRLALQHFSLALTHNHADFEAGQPGRRLAAEKVEKPAGSFSGLNGNTGRQECFDRHAFETAVLAC